MPKDNQKPLVIKSRSFVSDVKELRRRARQHMEKGAVTERIYPRMGHTINRDEIAAVAAMLRSIG